jgi:hypothetical protein
LPPFGACNLGSLDLTTLSPDFREAARPAVIKEACLTDAQRNANLSKHCCNLERESD